MASATVLEAVLAKGRDKQVHMADLLVCGRLLAAACLGQLADTV